jgi:protein-S-isoprenylcysteine O-methyltransferase Ste14
MTIGKSTGQNPLPKFWWRAKVTAGAGLIVWLCIVFIVLPPEKYPLVPQFFAQVIAVSGGCITLWHYRILGPGSRKWAQPETLVSRGGLYSFIRHPMYLGDAVLYLGLALLGSGWPAWFLLAFGWLALFLQARTEDRLMNSAFGDEFATWRSKTGLLLPFTHRL